MDITVTRQSPELYKRGVKGEVRVWRMEEGETGAGLGAHRVVSGIKDGAMTESGWTICEPKNVGKKNATTSTEQAHSEIENLYKIKSERGYFADIDQIDNVPFVKPMLAVDIEKRYGKFKFKDEGGEVMWAQPKLDGIRCIARADGLWTRTGKPIVALPHLVAALAPMFEDDPDLILDGELYNHALKDDFNTITSVVRKAKPSDADIEKARDAIEYHVYDMPSEDDIFSSRISRLKSLVEHFGGIDGAVSGIEALNVVETVPVYTKEELDAIYGGWIEDGYEGQMLRLNESYQFKRSNFLMKRKDFMSEEFPVIAMEEGRGNWAGCVKRFVVQLPNGNTCEATPRGTQGKLAELLQSGNTPDWATVRFFGHTPDGMLRFPIAVDYGHGARVD